MVVDVCGFTRCNIPDDFVHGFLTNVTVQELIVHTSGIPDHESNEDAINITTAEVEGTSVQLNPFFLASYLSPDAINSSQLLQIVADDYLYNASKPRKYSNTGYVVLGLILEHITGKDWAHAIDDFFDEYVPNDGEFACSARYNRDFSPKVPVAKVVSAYKRLDHNDLFVWDHVRQDPNLPINQIIDRRMWSNLVAQGGMVCSLKSLTNFMLALRAGAFPGVNETDFVYTDTPAYRGHAGGTGVEAILDTSSDMIVVGTASSGLTGHFSVPSVLSMDLKCLN